MPIRPETFRHGHPAAARRDSDGGIVLLATLMSLVLLSGMVVALQVRTQASVQVLSRIEQRHVGDLAETTIRARLAAQLDGPSPGPALDGTVQSMVVGGQRYDVRLTDVEGLIDLYLAPPEVLDLLPYPPGRLEETRTSVLAALPAGTRFMTVDQTLSNFGFDRPARQAILPLVTQIARTGEINPDLAPIPLRAAALQIDAQDIAGGQTAQLIITPASDQAEEISR